MKTSTDRILTTHVGSLPRTPELVKLLVQRDQHKPYDREALAAEAAKTVQHVVNKQLEAGLDIINDGEAPRVGFSTYVTERMTGFGGEGHRKPTLDTIKFPEYAAFAAKQIAVGDEVARVWNPPMAVEAVHYDDSLAGITEDLDFFETSLKNASRQPEETFFTAASPGIIATTLLLSPENPDYRTDRDYVFGIAAELKKEYEQIVARGHILQLDAPDLAMERVIQFGDQSLETFIESVKLHIEALNFAIADIPAEKVRLHLCWGNWQGPHQDDVSLDILPYIYEAKVGALSIPLANPRHQHETEAFRKYAPPADMVIIPGVIDVTTNYLEHPEVVAKRILEVVDAVGDPTRVIAGCDCGLATFASYEFVASDVAWAKLQALSEGAAIASQRIFG